MREKSPSPWGRARLFLVLPLALLLLAVSPTSSPGQQLDRPGEAGQKADDEEAKPKRLFNMEEIEILGQVEKPKTMFVIPKALHRYYWESEKKDFTPEILAPISRQEIEDMQRWRDSVGSP